MKNKDIKLIYSILGSFMLVLLQSDPFQRALGITNLIKIRYLGDITFFTVKIISFLATLLFIILSIKLILNNIKVND